MKKTARWLLTRQCLIIVLLVANIMFAIIGVIHRDRSGTRRALELQPARDAILQQQKKEQALIIKQRTALLMRIHALADKIAYQRYVDAYNGPFFGPASINARKQAWKDYEEYLKSGDFTAEQKDRLLDFITRRDAGLTIPIKLSPELIEAGVPQAYKFGSEYWDAQLLSELGAAKYKELAAYTEELPSRRELQKMAAKLESYSFALEKGQRDRLLGVMKTFPPPTDNSHECSRSGTCKVHGRKCSKISANCRRSGK